MSEPPRSWSKTATSLSGRGPEQLATKESVGPAELRVDEERAGGKVNEMLGMATEKKWGKQNKYLSHQGRRRGRRLKKKKKGELCRRL